MLTTGAPRPPPQPPKPGNHSRVINISHAHTHTYTKQVAHCARCTVKGKRGGEKIFKTHKISLSINQAWCLSGHGKQCTVQLVGRCSSETLRFLLCAMHILKRLKPNIVFCTKFQSACKNASMLQSQTKSGGEPLAAATTKFSKQRDLEVTQIDSPRSL